MILNKLKLVTVLILGSSALTGCASPTVNKANEQHVQEIVKEFKSKTTTDNDYLIILTSENNKTNKIEKSALTFRLETGINNAAQEKNSYQHMDLSNLSYIASYKTQNGKKPTKIDIETKTINYGLQLWIERDDKNIDFHTITVNNTMLTDMESVTNEATDTTPELTLELPKLNSVEIHGSYILKAGNNLTTFKAGPENTNSLTIYRGGTAKL